MFFFPVDLSSLSRKFQQDVLGVENVDNDKRPTGKKNTAIEWDDGGEKGNSNLILTEIFPLVHETRYLKVLIYILPGSEFYFKNAKWRYKL